MKLSALAILPFALTARDSRATQTSAPYVHTTTGFSFPQKVGDYRRVSVDAYNAEATDVGVGYDLLARGSQIATTVFVYPAPHVADNAKGSACEAQWRDVKTQIAEKHNGAKLLIEDLIASPSAAIPQEGHRAIFNFGGIFAFREQALQSEADLYCYVGGDWFIAYRTTSPVSVNYKPLFYQFLTTLTWPTK